MEFVSIDLFTWNSKKFCLVTDWYSGYCWYKEYHREPDSGEVIKFLEGIFREFGYPENLESDGGLQFRGEFERFTKRAGINWKVSSFNPTRSNGKIERQVAIIKHILDKTLRSGESFQEAWFCLQNKPCSAEGISPTCLFYGRIVRNTLLPQLSDGHDEEARADALHANIEKRNMKNNENKNRIDTNPLELK